MNKFTHAFIITVAGCFTAFAGLNYLVDPYGLFNSKRIAKLNNYKPMAKSQYRLTKAHHINSRRPEILLLGTSKVGRGLPCNVFNDTTEICYNAALTGARPYETYRSLQQQLVSNKNLKTIYLGLDYLFFMKEGLKKTEYKDNRFKYKIDLKYNESYPLQLFIDYITALNSMQASEASIKTIWSQKMTAESARGSGMPTFNSDGSWGNDETTLGAAPEPTLGARQEMRFQNIYGAHSGLLFELEKQKGKTKSAAHSNIKWVRLMIELCHDYDVQLSMFFNPAHILHWDLIDKFHRREDFELWKQKIVHTNSKIASLKKRPDFRITDFSGINKYNKQIPSPENKFKISNWYDDIYHYNKNLGRVIASILKDKCNHDTTNNFGVCLTPENFQEHKNNEKKTTEKYLQNNKNNMDKFNLRTRQLHNI
jgi:hypothetical protein